MTDRPGANSSRTWMLIAALVVVALLAWWLMSQSGDADQEPAYEAGATDVSGGELIVSDPEETGVPVEVPETAMTNAPSEDNVERAAEPAPPPPAE